VSLLPDHNNGIRISAVGTPPAYAGLHTNSGVKPGKYLQFKPACTQVPKTT